jgi:surface antigen
MRSNLIIVILGATLVTASCATKSQTGTAVGAGLGGGVGYAVGGTTGLLIGATVGGLLGHQAGKAMEEEDRRRAAMALEQGERTHWVNPRTGYEYTIQPEGTEYQNGRQCRDFKLLGEIDGNPEQITGTACRNPDGSWEQIAT